MSSTARQALDDQMARRILCGKQSIKSFEQALSSFSRTGSKFHRIGIADSTTSGPHLSEPWVVIQPEQAPSANSTASSATEKQTLVILDSSFNPPSKAHAALALSALSHSSSPTPKRLLLLLGTKNADKHAPVPASYAHRLAMLGLFSLDLQDTMRQRNMAVVPIDIGLASEPYHADKSAAIEQSGTYGRETKHLQVMGYDTLVRVLAPRYYKEFEPPLKALEPLFGRGHGAFVVLRPEDGKGIQDQRDEIQGMIGGGLKKDGFREEWEGLVEVVESEDAEGISSTDVRKAAEKVDWQTVEKKCTPIVAAWIKEEKLYEKGDKDGKI